MPRRLEMTAANEGLARMDGVGPQLRHAGLNLADDPRALREHFESDVFGFWVFLMSDAVVFALLFAVYGYHDRRHRGRTRASGGVQDRLGLHRDDAAADLLLHLRHGVLKLKRDPRARAVVLWLLVTLALGLSFLGMEVNDFVTMVSHGATADRSGFLSAFFVLVGMHGLHVTTGIVWGMVMLLQLLAMERTDRMRINLIRLSLFWHFLDVIWIGILSIVYLQGLIPGLPQ